MADDMDLDEALDAYFDSDVQPVVEELETYKRMAFKDIKRITDYINSQDRRFCRKFFFAGSNRIWRGEHADCLDEFDIGVMLEGMGSLVPSKSKEDRLYGFDRLEDTSIDTLNQPEDLEVVKMDIPIPPPPTGHCFLSAEDDDSVEKNEDLIQDGDLVPFLVKKRLNDLLTRAIDRDVVTDRAEVHKHHSKPLTFFIHYGTDTSGKKKIRVNFFPCIRSGLPFESRFGWPREKVWPGQEDVEEIEDIGVGVVGKTDFYWQYSFVDAQNYLTDGLDNDRGNRVNLYNTMTLLNTKVWCNTSKPVLSPDDLMNLLFWECQKCPQPPEWDYDHLWTRLESMLLWLLECMEKRKLKHYFCTGVNLFERKHEEELNIAATKIQNFLDNPLDFL